jgi:hypothetical protein
MIWVIVPVWLVGAAFTGALIARFASREIGEPVPEAIDWFGGALIGLIGWWLILPAFVFTYAVKRAYRFISKTEDAYHEAKR